MTEILKLNSIAGVVKENLPEDKIMEFAQSDEFATYKKLFNELGLS